jgi:hypothetical protein
MTQDKDFKKVVRRRAHQSGESYTEARRKVLSRQVDPPVLSAGLRRVDKPDLGLTVFVPDDWAEFPPQPANNPYEVARFQHHEAAARRICLIFRHPGSTGLSPQVPAGLVRAKREASRFCFANFTTEELDVAGWPAVRMEYDSDQFDFGRWFVRDYFLVVRNVVVEFSLGTTAPADDAETFNLMVGSFQVA